MLSNNSHQHYLTEDFSDPKSIRNSNVKAENYSFDILNSPEHKLRFEKSFD